MIKDTENFFPNVTGSRLNQDLGKYLNHVSQQTYISLITMMMMMMMTMKMLMMAVEYLNNHLGIVVSMKVLNTRKGNFCYFFCDNLYLSSCTLLLFLSFVIIFREAVKYFADFVCKGGGGYLPNP